MYPLCHTSEYSVCIFVGIDVSGTPEHLAKVAARKEKTLSKLQLSSPSRIPCRSSNIGSPFKWWPTSFFEMNICKLETRFIYFIEENMEFPASEDALLIYCTSVLDSSDWLTSLNSILEARNDIKHLSTGLRFEMLNAKLCNGSKSRNAI